MTKYEAKRIIAEEKMTWGDIKDLLREVRADENFNWESRSVVNKIMSKGVSFNIYWKGIQGHDDSQLVAHSRVGFVGANILREFSNRKVVRKKKELPDIHHQEPMEISE